MSLPTEDKTRKGLLMFQGLMRYFPHALAAVAESSRVANEQHNPGQPVHWAKEKSRDELDSLMRHLTDLAVDPEHRDPDGIRAAVKLAWRALANLERLHDAGVDIFHQEVIPPAPQVALRDGRHISMDEFTNRLNEVVHDLEEVDNDVDVEPADILSPTRNSLDDATPDEWHEASLTTGKTLKEF